MKQKWRKCAAADACKERRSGFGAENKTTIWGREERAGAAASSGATETSWRHVFAKTFFVRR